MKKITGQRPLYQIEVARLARKQLLQLPERAKLVISAAIDALARYPRPSGVKKLSGIDGYSIRVGDYRIHYLTFDKVLLLEVIRVANEATFTTNEKPAVHDAQQAFSLVIPSYFGTPAPFLALAACPPGLSRAA